MLGALRGADDVVELGLPLSPRDDHLKNFLSEPLSHSFKLVRSKTIESIDSTVKTAFDCEISVHLTSRCARFRLVYRYGHRLSASIMH